MYEDYETSSDEEGETIPTIQEINHLKGKLTNEKKLRKTPELKELRSRLN